MVLFNNLDRERITTALRKILVCKADVSFHSFVNYLHATKHTPGSRFYSYLVDTWADPSLKSTFF